MQIDRNLAIMVPDALNTEYMVEVGVGQNYGLEPNAELTDFPVKKVDFRGQKKNPGSTTNPRLSRLTR